MKERKDYGSVRLNASTDYAIRLIFYLAKEAKTVPSSKLAAAIGVSARYLLQIGAKLRDAGLIATTYGSTGGFSLLRSPQEISLYNIIIVMEGQSNNKNGITDEGKLTQFEILDTAYEYVDTVLSDILKSITIESLLSQSIETWYLAPCLIDRG